MVLIKRQLEVSGKRKRLRLQRIYDERCYECGGEKLIGHSLCEKHYLIMVAGQVLTKKEWEVLKMLFEEQLGRCYYTAAELFLGKNTSIDFVGGKPVWVLKNIAHARGNFNSAEEFVYSCEQVCRRLKPELFR